MGGMLLEGMPSTSKSFQHFRDALVGKRVSRVWRGYGSALFLELGELSASDQGEASISIEWSWRIEHGDRIVCGSWSEEEGWPAAFEMLHGKVLTEIALFGLIPEIAIGLEGDLRLISFMTSAGYPRWNLILRDQAADKWLSVSKGRIVRHDGSLID